MPFTCPSKKGKICHPVFLHFPIFYSTYSNMYMYIIQQHAHFQAQRLVCLFVTLIDNKFITYV